MPWFQVDDGLPANTKVRRLVQSNPKAFEAMGLWVLAGASSQAGPTDGVLTEGDLVSITLDRAKARRLAQILVAADLWHTAGHSCPHCPPVEAGSYVFHQWFQCGYETAAVVKLRRARDKEVKNPRITDAVRARDGDNCRYCGTTVNWKDRKSDRGGTYDHVIPGLAKGAENLVVACFRCNRAKGQRTPEQAGMALREPPATEPGSGEESVEDLSRINRIDRSSTDPRQKFGSSPGARASGRGGARVGRAGQGGAGQGTRQIHESQIEEEVTTP